jgi:hypothetical protein
MLQLQLPVPVKFICGLIYGSEEIYRAARKILEKKYGRVDFENETINFDFTDYYCPEMGKPLLRRFIAFKKLRRTEEFVAIKLFCLKLEKKFAVNRKRRINIDPGYLNEAKLVLTSRKDFAHRIYLGKGIYEEVTLAYRKNSFVEFPTTFPDYRTARYKEIFADIRSIYRRQIKS